MDSLCTMVSENRHFEAAKMALDGMTDWLKRMNCYVVGRDIEAVVRQGSKLGAHISQMCAVAQLLVKLNDHWEELWLMGVAESYIDFAEKSDATPSCSSSAMP